MGPACRLPFKYRPVAQLVEHRSPKPRVGGSSPSWPAIHIESKENVMVAKTEIETTNWVDTAKLVAAVVLLLAGIVQFYYFADDLMIYRVLALLALVAAALGVVFTTQLGQGVWGFMRDSRNEVRKVVWPTRQETIQTTLLVIAMVVLVGIMLWLMDIFLRWAVMLLTGQGS
jgi:preprotein translocase subunit SecE